MKLKTENEKLEEKVKLLSKELDFLKNIFMAHAGEMVPRVFVDKFMAMPVRWHYVFLSTSNLPAVKMYIDL
jgi:hypothetical protein